MAEEAYGDSVNGTWHYETIPAGAPRTFGAAFTVSQQQAEDLQAHAPLGLTPSRSPA